MPKPRRYARVTDPLPDRAIKVPPGAVPWVVYVLTDEDRARYSISMAKDVDARVFRHRQLISPVIRHRTPILVLTERFADRYTALARMKRLRAWALPQLIALIEAENPAWKDLSSLLPGEEM